MNYITTVSGSGSVVIQRKYSSYYGEGINRVGPVVHSPCVDYLLVIFYIHRINFRTVLTGKACLLYPQNFNAGSNTVDRNRFCGKWRVGICVEQKLCWAKIESGNIFVFSSIIIVKRNHKI